MMTSETVIAWFVRLDATVEQVAAWRNLLSGEERSRAEAFLLDEHRRDYITAHAAMRQVLGQRLGIPAAAVMFKGRDGNGLGGSTAKPELDWEQMPGLPKSALRFNLSHTDGAALIGVSEGRELGVDIERHRAMDDLKAMALSVMSVDEQSLWGNLPENAWLSAFFHVWTRKESYLKAIGRGLYRSLQQVTVHVSAERLDEGHPVLDEGGIGTWSVQDLPVPPGFSASICCAGDAMPEIVVRGLDLWTIA